MIWVIIEMAENTCKGKYNMIGAGLVTLVNIGTKKNWLNVVCYSLEMMPKLTTLNVTSQNTHVTLADKLWLVLSLSTRSCHSCAISHIPALGCFQVLTLFLIYSIVFSHLVIFQSCTYSQLRSCVLFLCYPFM